MATLSFEIHAWWHAGTGQGRGNVADAVVHRDADGLPFLPGRSVKGLLRAAMQLAEGCGRIEPGRTEEWFGTPLPGAASPDDAVVDAAFAAARYETTPGTLRFTSATLGREWAAWARSLDPEARPRELGPLFALVAQTAVDDDGVVDDHSLRTIEVTTPMTLRADVEGPADSRWLEALDRVAPLVRHLGAHRNRGLGRVTVRVEKGA